MNCIGFYNYKSFMSLLINATLVLFLITMTYAEHVHVVLFNLEEKRYWYLFLITFTFSLTCVMFFGIVFFTLWNIMLILFGITTIEFLDNTKSVNFLPSFRNPFKKYDRGCYGNWVAVFGSNPFFWLSPFRKAFWLF